MRIPKIKYCPWCFSADLKRKNRKKYTCNGCGLKLNVSVIGYYVVIRIENSEAECGIRMDYFKEMRRGGKL